MSDLMKELVEEVKEELAYENVHARSNISKLKDIPDPEPTLVPDPGLGIKCHKCDKAALIDPYIESKGLATSEKFNYLKLLADKVGWKYSINIVDDETFIDFTCPACFYSKYNSKCACPKCGNRKLTSKYNNGTASPLGMLRENIERRCERCGFLFTQNCLEE